MESRCKRFKTKLSPFFKMRTNEKYIYNGKNIEIGDTCCV